MGWLRMFFLALGLVVIVEAKWPRCARLGESCDATADCCIGFCVDKNCQDGLQRPEGYDYIEHELETGLKVDVYHHKNIDLLSPLTECGLSGANSTHVRRKRIVGGKAVNFGEYPWMVQLYLHNITFGHSYFHCGGTLITRRHILTAAHCLTRIGTALTLKAVVIGNHDRRTKKECDENNSTCTWSTHREIDEIIVHENYSEGNLRNDIGLIRLGEDIEITPLIRPICLPRSEMRIQGWKDGKLTAVGWGTQNKYNDEGPKVVSYKEQEVENTLVSRENCNRFFTRVLGKLQRSQICAGGYPGKGDCQGDSGGPLLKKIKVDDTYGDRYYQFGIVSTGAVVKCGYQGKPSVYSNVMWFMPWILDNIAPPGEKRPSGIAVLDSYQLMKNVGTDENPVWNKTAVNPADQLASGENMNITSHANYGLLPKFPDCGGALVVNSTRVKRIVGGRPAGITVFPWMVQVYVRHSVTLDLHLRCGGTLINSKYVLTSAHCVTEITAPFTVESVTLGGYNRMLDEECSGGECIQPKTMFLEEVFIHDEFTKYAHDNDIALIRLPEEVTFNKFIQPICLPHTEEVLKSINDKKFTTTGWGRVSADASEFSTSNILNAVNISLIHREACDSVYSRQMGVLDRSKLCGGGVPGKGECAGDGGGPLQKFVNGSSDDSVKRYFQFGIVSSSECAQQGMPTVYANIMYYMPWILDHMEP